MTNGKTSQTTHNTLISLREYVDIRFEAQEKAVNAALAAADRAVNKAEMASEKRFENMNEFRGALSDASRLLMPRAESEKSSGVLSEKIATLETRVNAHEERGAGAQQSWITLGLAVSVLANIVLIFYYLSRPHA